MEGSGQKQRSDILLLNKGHHEPPRREVGRSRSPGTLPPPGFSLALPSIQMLGQRLQTLPGPMCVTPGGVWELLRHNSPSQSGRSTGRAAVQALKARWEGVSFEEGSWLTVRPARVPSRNASSPCFHCLRSLQLRFSI